MENNVLISVKTVQKCDGETYDPVELQTPGKFGIIHDKYYIKYQESEMTGFPDTVTTVKIWPDHVMVTRKGKFQMQLHYEKGEKNLCLYPTPYGNIATAIATKDVRFSFQGEKGFLEVEYILDADNENFIENTLHMEISPL